MKCFCSFVLCPSSLLCSCIAQTPPALVSEHTKRDALLHYELYVFAERTTNSPATRAHRQSFSRNRKTRQNTKDEANGVKHCASTDFSSDWRHRMHSAHVRRYRHVLCRHWKKFENAFAENWLPGGKSHVFTNRNTDCRHEPNTFFRFSMTCALAHIPVDEGKHSALISTVRISIAIGLLNLTSLSFHT